MSAMYPELVYWHSFHGSFVSYSGASKVAAQTTPVHSFMGLVKRRLEEHEARGVCTCVL